jgi:hypothetical protein
VVPQEEPIPACLLGLGGEARDDRRIRERVEEREVETEAHGDRC